MERFSDWTIDDGLQAYTISAWDSVEENAPEIEITYFELLGFTRSRYSMTRTEAINHLARCGEEEIENLLKELFKSKYK